MNQKYPADKVMVQWKCLSCGHTSEQCLPDIAEVGTAICDCGDDMVMLTEVVLLPKTKRNNNENNRTKEEHS